MRKDTYIFVTKASVIFAIAHEALICTAKLSSEIIFNIASDVFSTKQISMENLGKSFSIHILALFTLIKNIQIVTHHLLMKEIKRK